MNAVKGFTRGFAMTLPMFLVGKFGVKKMIQDDSIKTSAAIAIVSTGVMALSTRAFGRSPSDFNNWPTSERLGFRLGCVVSPGLGAIVGVNEEIAKA